MTITEYSAVTDRRIYEQLAEVIREKTGITETITPEEMAAIVRELNHVENVKRWTVNVPETVESTVTLLESEPWIAEHYADDNLAICVIPTDTRTGAYRMFGGTFGTNYSLIETTQGTGYGASLQNSGGAQTLAAGVETNPIKDSTKTFAIFVSVNGNVKVISSAGYSIVAGDYNIIAWLV